MANDVTRLSIRDYAKSLAISDTAVRKAIANGKIKKGVSYIPKMQAGKEVNVPEIIKEIADKEWGFTHKVDKVKPGQNKVERLDKAEAKSLKTEKTSLRFEGANLPADVDLSEEDEKLISSLPITKDLKYQEIVRRREMMGLIMDKYKLQEIERIMIRKDVVEKSLYGFGVELKKALLNIPARITSEVRSADNDVTAQTIITVELTNILDQFSNLEELKL